MKAKRIAAFVLAAGLICLAGCAEAAPNQDDYERGYAAGFDAGFASGQESAAQSTEQPQETPQATADPLEIARLERELDKYQVMNQQWKDAFDSLLAAAGLSKEEKIEWRFVAFEIEATNGNPDVYVDVDGEYYHREWCSHLSDTPVEVCLSYVRDQNIEPCPDCNPVA